MDYVERFLKQRKKLNIAIHYHALCRQDHRHIDEEEIMKTVISGTVNRQKCQEFSDKPYNKICLHHYFGKCNKTVELILLHDEEFAYGEVRTVWEQPGRKSFKDTI